MTTTTTTTTSTTTSTTSTTTTTFAWRDEIGFVTGWSSSSTTTSSTTTQPSYGFEWGVPPNTNVRHPTSEQITVVRGTAVYTAMDPFSLKTFADFGGRVGIFDGVTKNLVDTGTNVHDFTVLAPQHRPSVSSTTSTTSTSTTTTTTTVTTVSTSSTTTV